MSLFNVMTRVGKHYYMSRSDIYAMDYYEFSFALSAIKEIEEKNAEDSKKQEQSASMDGYMSKMSSMMPKMPSGFR